MSDRRSLIRSMEAVGTERNETEELKPEDMGGDPPCWAGLVKDHRDCDPPPDQAVNNFGRQHMLHTDEEIANARMVPADATVATARPDVSTPTQVHYLVTAFYVEIMLDELLEPIFGEVAEVDWAEHIPKLIDYWCWILFRTKEYAGAVTRTHRNLHGLQPIQPAHCDRWFSLWVSCVDGRWAGPYAERAKAHAATLMSGMAKRVFGFDWTAPVPASALPPLVGP